MGGWERAEPDFKPKTKRQLDAEMRRSDRDFEREQAEREARRRENLERYDPERHEARLAPLEDRAILDHQRDEIVRYRSGEAFPAMDPKRRAEEIANLDEGDRRYQARVEELELVVGDPEDVPDAQRSSPH